MRMSCRVWSTLRAEQWSQNNLTGPTGVTEKINGKSERTHNRKLDRSKYVQTCMLGMPLFRGATFAEIVLCGEGFSRNLSGAFRANSSSSQDQELQCISHKLISNTCFYASSFVYGALGPRRGGGNRAAGDRGTLGGRAQYQHKQDDKRGPFQNPAVST